VKRWTAALALLFMASCAVEDLVLATSDGPPDGGHRPPPLHPCASNDDCRPEDYCDKATCQDVMGGCMSRPTVIPPGLDPTCGCDEVTYYNDWWRKASRIAASTRGECDVPTNCGGSAPYMPCPPPQHCSQLLPESMAMCGPNIKGRCWFLPPQGCDPNAPGNSQRWMSCDRPGPCVDTCTAIWNNGPHYPAQCP
jgi:hypothetical protein